jgi:DNA-binding response OmpR family regulator
VKSTIPKDNAAADASPRGQIRILLVEDDAPLANAMSSALASSGYEVAIASTGSDARAKLDRTRPDLIILDLMLPDVDGLMLLIALKSSTDAPVVICSARAEQVDHVLGLRLGAADFVGKPFDLNDLESRINRVLRARLQAQPVASTTSR